jgi:hypothetical protein
MMISDAAIVAQDATGSALRRHRFGEERPAAATSARCDTRPDGEVKVPVPVSTEGRSPNDARCRPRSAPIGIGALVATRTAGTAPAAPIGLGINERLPAM